MKLRYIFIPIILLMLIVPALLPSQVEVQRKIVINGTQEDVFAYVVNLQAWEEWSPWLSQEPDAEHSFEGIPGVVGSSMQWKGNKIGHGKQTLTKIEESSYLETKLEFFEPQESEAVGYMKVTSIGEGQAEVLWGFKSEMSYPAERIFGLLLDNLVGKDFENGLKLLKTRLEEGPKGS